MIRAFVDAVDGKVPIIAGITWKAPWSPPQEAKRAAEAGATGALVYPEPRLAAFRLSEGRPAGPLQGDP